MTPISFICSDISSSPELAEQVCAAFESAVPGLRMNATHGASRPQAIKDRRQFIAERFATYRRESLEPWSMFISNEEVGTELTSLTLWLPFRYLPERADVSLIALEVPDHLNAKTLCDILERIGDVVNAWHGTVHIRSEHVGVSDMPPRNAELNPLNVETGRGAFKRNPNVARHLLPPALHRMHYFSSESARQLGFPHLPEDEAWLVGSRPTSKGAWIIQITQEPLDLRKDEHCAALSRAYERFDKGWLRAS